MKTTFVFVLVSFSLTINSTTVLAKEENDTLHRKDQFWNKKYIQLN